MLREAIDALVLMISPFAPHTAEELWQMLGHADGLATAQWPSFDPAVAKADEVVVPVQINGKVRARLTVPADASEDQLRELALADPAVAGAHGRQDDPQGRRRQGAARQRGGVSDEQRAAQDTADTRLGSSPASLCVLCVLGGALVGIVGCGYALAGRGSFLPAYIQTIGIPTFANRTTVFNLETLLTQKVRAEFIGRGKYQILPESTGVDALLTGEVTARRDRAGQLHTPAARVALRAHDDGAHRAARRAREQGALGEPQRHLPAGVRRDRAAPTRSDPAAFFGQDANALERMSTDFARTIVSAILEAF